MAWVIRPPETVKSGEVFTVIYSVTAQDSFYDWAMKNNIFTHRLIHQFKLNSSHLHLTLVLDLNILLSSEPVFTLVWCVYVFSSIVNADAARMFCEHHECPANWKDADGENCCIHHANIHSCPMGYMVHTLFQFYIYFSSFLSL